MIIPIWKEIGQSTHQLAKKVGQKVVEKSNNKEDKKATHTGTLDPMAEGVVIVLTGEDRFKKSNFSDWKKTYEFKMLIGVSTDTHDLLGIQNKITKDKIDLNEVEDKIKKILPKFIGKQTQIQPSFSSQRINGKSGFDLAKDGIKFENKINKIEIFDLKLISTSNISLEKIKQYLYTNIHLVKGDFRQGEIIDHWNQTLKKLNKNNLENLILVKIKAETSKKTYIRSLVRDIAADMKIFTSTFSITRTNQGAYSKSDCKYIE